MALLKLLLVQAIVLLLELPHFLDFVEVNYEASFLIVQVFNTFAAKY